MERHEPDEHTSLNLEEFTPFSMDSASTFVASPAPATTVHHRQSYQRVPSMQEQDTSYRGATAADEGKGLGISNVKAAQGPSIEVSLSEENSPAAPNSAGFLLSPTFSRSSKKAYRPLDDSPGDDGEFHPEGRSRSPSLFRPFTADSEHDTLRQAPRTSMLSPYGPSGGEHPDFACKTKQHFYHPRGELASVLILMASAWSTVFSAIWLGLATGRPHYGQLITHKSQLPPGTASLLVAAFAKSIELTFVTSFVAFLGQLLSQRAFRKNSDGITVAQMQMRTWILQPGTLITHAAAVRYAAVTFLGAIAFFAALLAMFYTTASDGLVSPKLRFGKTNHRILTGNVNTRFANVTYIQQQCLSPIDFNADPDHGGQTCMAIEHSGQAYHNYAQYLANWTDTPKPVSTNLQHRPLPVGTLYDNTTVQGSWINVQDMTENSNIFKRMVNNVSMAMPHAGVFAAATNPRNRILQPQDRDGLGEFNLEASVPSPTVNVLCAAMSADELTPMILSKWPAYKDKKFNMTAYSTGVETDIPSNSTWLNKTVVDGIFGFGERYGRRMPIFPILPEPYNTILNYSAYPVNTDSLYLLATGPSIADEKPYALCSLRASLSPNCSTIYHSTMTGGQMRTNCEDPHNPLAYSKSQPSAINAVVYNNEWRDVAVQWASSLSLNAGLNNQLASNARLLAQFIPTSFSLNTSIPSIAEALGVLAGSTLLLSSYNASFLHFFNYTDERSLSMPFDPAIEPFNATLRVQDYSSGGTQKWQGIFYVVLASVFCLNLLCLAYFITHTGLVTDFMEPQNLFALSLNSPPSQVLDGTCGGGPTSQHYRSTWHIWMNRGEHFYIESTDDPVGRMRRGQEGGGGRGDIELQGGKSPVAEMYNRLSKKRSSIL